METLKIRDDYVNGNLNISNYKEFKKKYPKLFLKLCNYDEKFLKNPFIVT